MSFGRRGPGRSGTGDAGHPATIDVIAANGDRRAAPPATAWIIHGRDGRSEAVWQQGASHRDMSRNDRAADDGSPSLRQEPDHGPAPAGRAGAAADSGGNRRLDGNPWGTVDCHRDTVTAGAAGSDSANPGVGGLPPHPVKAVAVPSHPAGAMRPSAQQGDRQSPDGDNPFCRPAGFRPGRRRHGSPTGSEAFIAALDLGTNNCRLLIARIETDGFRVVDAFSRVVRLGEGLAATGRLAPAAMHRTIEALKVCAAKLRRWRVANLRCVATEACRRADNCSQFIDRVWRETGLAIEIISPAEEATLALAGCAPLLDSTRPHAIVFDIGGGSTELSWLAIAADRPPRLLDWVSAPVGVVTLTERFGSDLIGHERYGTMIDEVQGLFRDFSARHDIPTAVAAGRVQMLGTSGTVTTLAGIHMDLPRYNRSRVDGTTMAFPVLTAISNTLARLDFEGRAAYPCIGRERADLVVSGCAILEAIRRTWPVDRLRIADRGLREGILLGLRQQVLHASVAAVPCPVSAADAGHSGAGHAGGDNPENGLSGPSRPAPPDSAAACNSARRRGPAAAGKRRRRRRRGRRKAGGAAAPIGRDDRT